MSRDDDETLIAGTYVGGVLPDCSSWRWIEGRAGSVSRGNLRGASVCWAGSHRDRPLMSEATRAGVSLSNPTSLSLHRSHSRTDRRFGRYRP